MFYKSFEEKTNSESAKVYGLAYSKEENNGYSNAYVISNRNDLEYKITIRSEDSSSVRMIQDYSENKAFLIPFEQTGFIQIEWREKGTEDNAQLIEIGL